MMPCRQAGCWGGLRCSLRLYPGQLGGGLHVPCPPLTYPLRAEHWSLL